MARLVSGCPLERPYASAPEIGLIIGTKLGGLKCRLARHSNPEDEAREFH